MFSFTNVNLSWSTDLRGTRLIHFFPMSNPTRESSHRKHHSKHIHWNIQCAVDNSTVEIHIGIEFLVDEVLIFQGRDLKTLCNLKQRVIDSHFGQNLIASFLDDRRTWIEVLVNAMTKPHEFESRVLVFG